MKLLRHRSKSAAPGTGEIDCDSLFQLGRDYPFPLVLPIGPGIRYSELPVRHCWAGYNSDGESASDAALQPISAAAIDLVRSTVAAAAL